MDPFYPEYLPCSYDMEPDHLYQFSGTYTSRCRRCEDCLFRKMSPTDDDDTRSCACCGACFYLEPSWEDICYSSHRTYRNPRVGPDCGFTPEEKADLLQRYYTLVLPRFLYAAAALLSHDALRLKKSNRYLQIASQLPLHLQAKLAWVVGKKTRVEMNWDHYVEGVDWLFFGGFMYYPPHGRDGGLTFFTELEKARNEWWSHPSGSYHLPKNKQKPYPLSV